MKLYFKKIQNILSDSKIYYSLLIVDIAICTILNYHADLMKGILPNYIDYASFFSSLFDLNTKFISNSYTFPMWGYGLVIAVTKSKLIIILFQQLLTLGTIFSIDFFARKYNWIKSIVFFRFLLLISFNWFFFHSSLYPYSISANLLILSVFLLLIFLQTKKVIALLTSGILFGILLNFRSDFYYYFIFVFIILIILKLCKKIIVDFKWLIVWLLLINLFLVPWGIYTFKRTGHYIQTSTNAGHVFFISLGQLPNNCWGITPKDGDPLMKELLQKKFGANANSLNYESDKFLLKQWKNNVRNHPFEYAKKCLYNIFMILKSPFYCGNVIYNFYSSEEISAIKTEINKSETFISRIKTKLAKYGGYLFIQLFFNLLGQIVFFMFIIYFIKYFFAQWRNFFSDPFGIILISLILYQLSLCVFTFFMTIYLSNVYLIFIFLIVYYRDKYKYNRSLL